MLHVIKDISDPLLDLIKDDPVRPHIPSANRIGNNRDVFVLQNEETFLAVVCVRYQSFVPFDEDDLFKDDEDPTIAIFYTVWSYAKGAGRQIIFDAVAHIKECQPRIQRYVTLSPQTEMARKFHLGNGAVVYRENVTTVNYEYEFLRGDTWRQTTIQLAGG